MNRHDAPTSSDLLGPVGRPGGSGGNPVMVVLGILYAVALGLSVALIMNIRVDVGVTGVLLVLTMGPVAFIAAMAYTDRRRRVLLDRVEDMNRSVRTLTDQATLSNDARRVLNRQVERDLLHLPSRRTSRTRTGTRRWSL